MVITHTSRTSESFLNWGNINHIKRDGKNITFNFSSGDDESFDYDTEDGAMREMDDIGRQLGLTDPPNESPVTNSN